MYGRRSEQSEHKGDSDKIGEHKRHHLRRCMVVSISKAFDMHRIHAAIRMPKLQTLL